MTSGRGPLVAAVLLGGCSHWITSTEEVKVGTCASEVAARGGTCRRGTIDYGVWLSSTFTGDDHRRGGNYGFRWRFMEAALDDRGMRRSTTPADPNAYDSVAGTIGLHVSPTLLLPPLHRYLDLAITGGLELGGIDFGGTARGRGGGYYGATVELSLPDLFGLAYEDHGVPALHAGIRRTAYVEGWSSLTTFEVGLAWRWGTPVEYHRYTFYKPALD